LTLNDRFDVAPQLRLPATAEGWRTMLAALTVLGAVDGPAGTPEGPTNGPHFAGEPRSRSSGPSPLQQLSGALSGPDPTVALADAVFGRIRQKHPLPLMPYVGRRAVGEVLRRAAELRPAGPWPADDPTFVEAVARLLLEVGGLRPVPDLEVVRPVRLQIVRVVLEGLAEQQTAPADGPELALAAATDMLRHALDQGGAL